MEALKVHQEKGSLLDLLDEWNLPVLVTVSAPHKFEDELDLHVGSEFCVLERKKVKVLIGEDFDKVTFRVKIEEQEEIFVDVVNEKHPLNLNELRCSLPRISYLLTKAEFQYKSICFKKWEKYKIKEYEDSTGNICLLTSSNDKLFLPLEFLLCNNSFSFIEYIETIELQHFLKENLDFQTVCSRYAPKSFPPGLVTLKGVRSCDAILTVANPTNQQLKKVYKMFELDKQIKASISPANLPSHVLALGSYNSNAYRDCIKEIEFLLNFSIYSVACFGSLVIENLTNSEMLHDATRGVRKSGKNDFLPKPSAPTMVRERKLSNKGDIIDSTKYINEEDNGVKIREKDFEDEKRAVENLYEKVQEPNLEDKPKVLKKRHWSFKSFSQNKKNESGSHEGAVCNITKRLRKTGFPAISWLHPKESIKDGEKEIEKNNGKREKILFSGYKNSNKTKRSDDSPFNLNGLSLNRKKQISKSEPSLIDLSSNKK